MSGRKLASIQQISKVVKHPNADLLDLVTVQGWQCVAKRDEFKDGDCCIYFEVDSVLPVQPEYEFLRKSCYTRKDWLPAGEGFRLKTIKLRGELSQGLVVPLSKPDYLPYGVGSIIDKNGNERYIACGDDITDDLNVVKWEPPLPAQLQGQAQGMFPSFIPKTDAERAQNLVSEIASAFDSGEEFECTLKLDGSSCTVFLKETEFGICSRHIWLKDNEENRNNSFIRAVHDSCLPEAMYKLMRNIAVQAELMGPGVQGNRENLKNVELFVFNIFDIDEQKYLPPNERYSVFSQLKEFGFTGNHIPIMYYKTRLPYRDVESLLKYAEGPSYNCSVREGFVWKSHSTGFNFKTISNQYLLGEK